jgi:hypothetical protein
LFRFFELVKDRIVSITEWLALVDPGGSSGSCSCSQEFVGEFKVLGGLQIDSRFKEEGWRERGHFLLFDNVDILGKAVVGQAVEVDKESVGDNGCLARERERERENG